MQPPTSHTNHPHGYRLTPNAGATVRSDIVDVYVYRRRTPPQPTIEFLQLLRSSDPMAGTWHPVMGHIESGETACQCAAREMVEELGLQQSNPSLLHFFALEQVHPYFIPRINTIVLSPRFAAEVSHDWTPVLNSEHRQFRWTPKADAPLLFMWPGQRAACGEIVESHALEAPEQVARYPSLRIN